MKNMKTKKPLSKAQLHLKACHLLAVPPSLILNIVPNCAKSKYFINWLTVSRNGKPVYHTELVTAKDLEKQKL